MTKRKRFKMIIIGVLAVGSLLIVGAVLAYVMAGEAVPPTVMEAPLWSTG